MNSNKHTNTTLKWTISQAIWPRTTTLNNTIQMRASSRVSSLDKCVCRYREREKNKFIYCCFKRVCLSSKIKQSKGVREMILMGVFFCCCKVNFIIFRLFVYSIRKNNNHKTLMKSNLSIARERETDRQTTIYMSRILADP